MREMIPVENVIAALPKARQRVIEKRGKVLLDRVARRMTLAEVRKERKVTQTKIAKELGIGQMQISRLERRKDPRLSTMERTVAAMGGQLILMATFPDQEPVILASASPAKESRAGTKKKAQKRVA